MFPAEKETVSPENGELTVRGFAWSGGGRAVIRVDVTADGGETWHTATLEPTEEHEDGQNGEADSFTQFGPWNRTWSWRIWEASIPVKVSQ